MKKIISVFLVLIMTLSVFAVPASAASTQKVKYPIIFIAAVALTLLMKIRILFQQALMFSPMTMRVN